MGIRPIAKPEHLQEEHLQEEYATQVAVNVLHAVLNFCE